MERGRGTAGGRRGREREREGRGSGSRAGREEEEQEGQGREGRAGRAAREGVGRVCSERSRGNPRRERERARMDAVCVDCVCVRESGGHPIRREQFSISLQRTYAIRSTLDVGRTPRAARRTYIASTPKLWKSPISTPYQSSMQLSMQLRGVRLQPLHTRDRVAQPLLLPPLVVRDHLHPLLV